MNDNQFKMFPGTRYMGSKLKIIDQLWQVLGSYNFETVFDGFAGSNVVGYYMKTRGKRVVTNDFMASSYVLSKAIIENNDVTLDAHEARFLLESPNEATFVSANFRGLYFTDEDNKLIDRIRFNLESLGCDYKRSLGLAALVRSCVKKRPRGIFTYVGNRYNDGRKDLSMSIGEHFLESVHTLNQAVFSNGQRCLSMNEDTLGIGVCSDLAYFDPPYFTPLSDNDYTRRYHFVEGLVRNWKGVAIQEHTKTKKFKSYKTPFSSRTEVVKAFDRLVSEHSQSAIAISYSSNSFPSKSELFDLLTKHRSEVQCHEIDHVYSFGNRGKQGMTRNRVKEYLFVAR